MSRRGPCTRQPSLVADAARLIADLDGGAGRGRARCRATALAARPRRRAAHVGPQAGRRRASPTPTRSSCATACGPTRWPEDEFEAAHRRLDEVLPGSGPLAERYVTWREAQAIAPETLPAVIDSLADDLRAAHRPVVRPARRRAHRLGAGDGPAVVGVQLLPRRPAQPGRHQHRPAGAVDHRSRTWWPTRPIPATTPSTPARRSGSSASERHLEETIFLVGTPQCLLAEGLADLGLEVVMGRRPEATVAEHLRPLGVPLRPRGRRVGVGGRRGARPRAGQRGVPVARGRRRSRRRRRLRDALSAWCNRDRAEKMVQFLTDPTWRAYISCYLEGLPAVPLVRRRRPGPLPTPARRAADPGRPDFLALRSGEPPCRRFAIRVSPFERLHPVPPRRERHEASSTRRRAMTLRQSVSSAPSKIDSTRASTK